MSGQRFVGPGTTIAALIAVGAATLGGLSAAPADERALVGALGGVYTVATLVALFVGDRRRAAAPWIIVALTALGGGLVWVTRGIALLALMPAVSIAVLFVGTRFAIAVTAALAGLVAVQGFALELEPGMAAQRVAAMLAASCFVLVFSRLVVSERTARDELAVANARLSEYAKEIEHAKKHEVMTLNAELRHQVAERSKDLASAMGGTLAPASRSAEVAEGEVFDGRYRVAGTLGRGAMGMVFEVARLADGRRLALKVLQDAATKDAAARFFREAEIAARLSHPYLISVIDVGVTPGGLLYLVMELVAGASLDAQRARFGDAKWALPLLCQVAEGLVELHAKGVVHRDLKPCNVLLAQTQDGDA